MIDVRRAIALCIGEVWGNNTAFFLRKVGDDGAIHGATKANWFLCLLAFLGFFSLFPKFDDIPWLKEDTLQCRLPFGFPSQQKFEIHAKVLEFFCLRIGHDGTRIGGFRVSDQQKKKMCKESAVAIALGYAAM